MAVPARILPAIIFLLYISTSAQAVSENEVNSKVKEHELHVDFKRNVGVISEANKTFDGSAYACGECNSETSDFFNCHATVMNFDNDETGYNNTCPVFIQKRHSDNFLNYIRLLLQKNKAIFVYETRDAHDWHFRLVNQTFHIVDTGRNENESCKKHHITLRLAPYLSFVRQINIARYTNIIYHDNDYFDLYVDGGCEGARCKYSYNDKAEQIGAPEPYLPKEYLNHSIKIFPSTQSEAHFTFVAEWPPETYVDRHSISYYFTDELFNSELLLYVNGSEFSELALFDYRTPIDHEKFIDNSNGLFSVCKKNFDGKKYGFNCMQFNESDLVFNVTSSAKLSEKLIATYNLPEGGILLVKGDLNNCTNTCSEIWFEKWTNERLQKTYSVHNFIYNLSIVKAKLYEKQVGNNTELCLSIYNEQDEFEGPTGYRLLMRCFENSLLTNGGQSHSYNSILHFFTCIVMLIITIANTL